MEQDVKANGYQMSPLQGVQLLCVADLLRRGQLEICGEDQEDADRALAAILEAAQEIALQWEMTDTPSIKIGDYTQGDECGDLYFNNQLGLAVLARLEEQSND